MRFYIGAVGSWAYGAATEVELVRFPHDTPLESSAEGADASVAGWVINDSAGVYNVNGLRPAWADEDDVETAPDDPTTGIRIWSGFVTVRRWKRAEGYRAGPARLIEVDLFDINSLLKRHAIVTADGKRPAELDSARIDWVLGGVLDGIVFDNGLLDYSGPAIMLDEADYRDNYAVDVLGDAGAISAKDFYVIWDSSAPTGQEVTLVYEQRSATQRIASLGISNVRTDQNLDDIWEPSQDSVLERSPENVYSGVDQVYLGGNRVYAQNATTLANFLGSGNQSLDLVVSSSRIGKLTTAQSQAQLQLQIHSMEKDIIECRLFLPVEKVNWVMAGQAVQFRASHMDGYETAQTMKVLRKSVIHPWPDRRRFYEVALRLANGEAGAPVAGGGGGNPPPDDFPPPTDLGDCTPTQVNLGYPVATATATGRGALAAGSLADYGVDGLSEQGDPLVLFDQFADNHGIWPRYYNAFLGSTKTIWGVVLTAGNFYVGGTNPQDFGGGWYTGADGGGSVLPPPTQSAYSSGLTVGTLHTFAAPVTTAEICFSYVADMTGGFAVQAPLGFTEMLILECVPPDPVIPAPGQWIAAQEKVGDGDGTTDTWTTDFPFADGSLRVWYDTVNQTPAIASYDGVAGTFTMQGPALDGQQVFVLYQGR